MVLLQQQDEVGLIRGMLIRLKSEGVIEVDDIDTLTQLFFGSMAAAALVLARSKDPAAYRASTCSRMRARYLLRRAIARTYRPTWCLQINTVRPCRTRYPME